jgi:tetratricopeptide (TPR) repeat protein
MKFCRKCGVSLVTDKASTPNVIAKRHVYETKITQEPGNTNILVEYGNYLLLVGLIDEALIQYFSAIELKAEDETVRMRIVEAYHGDKQYDNAITQLLIIMEVRPEDIALKEKLYSIYLEAEKLSDAAELLRQMYDLEPSNLNHLVRRLDILRKGEHSQDRLEVCNILHQEKPFQYPACSLYIGIAMSESANGSADPELLAQAERMLQNANSHIEKLNSEEQVSCRLYLYWTQLKLKKNAFDFIQDLKEIGQKSLSKTQQTILADCFLIIGNAQFQAELIQDAIESYKASYSYSDTLQVRHSLAKAYLKSGNELHGSGKYKEASKEFRTGLFYQPDNSELQAGLAISQSKKQKQQEIRFTAAFAGLAIIISIGLFLYYGQNALEVECNQAATISLTKGESQIATKEGNLLQTSLLRYGSYIVQIEKEGYASIKEEVNPGIGRGVKRIKYDLKPNYGALKVSSDPGNAKVVIKNRYTEKSCTTPCEIDQLFAMPSSIELRIPGYELYKVENTIPQGNVLDLGTVVFKGALKVDSDPSDADVFINDQLKGKTPFQVADLPAKKTKIEIKKKAMGVYIANTGITPNGSTDLGVVTLSKLGTIRIDSKPQGAKVFLDRAQTGITPFSMSDIEPGSHVLRVEYPECSPIERNITLQSGEMANLGTVSFQCSIVEGGYENSEVGRRLFKKRYEKIISSDLDGIWKLRNNKDWVIKEIILSKQAENLLKIEGPTQGLFAIIFNYKLSLMFDSKCEGQFAPFPIKSTPDNNKTIVRAWTDYDEKLCRQYRFEPFSADEKIEFLFPSPFKNDYNVKHEIKLRYKN